MKIPLPLKVYYRIVLTAVISLFFTYSSYSQASCAAAVTLTDAATCGTNTISLQGATSTAPSGGCGGATLTTTFGRWYKFTATTTGPIFTVSLPGTTNLATGSTYIELLTGTTCAALTSVQCQTVATPLNTSNLTIGTVYYIRVYVTGSTASGTAARWQCNICMQNPVNDECTGATSLTLGGAAITGTLINASSSVVPAGCGDSNSPDVWYSFVASTSPYPIITLSTPGANFTTDIPVMELYSGTCGALVSLGCTTSANYLVGGTGLTLGATYYVRVATSGLSAAVTTGTHTFKIAVANSVAPTVDYGKSYINVTKGTNGGTVEPGDVLEIRSTFVVKAGAAFDCMYADNVPSNTTFIPGSIQIITNEGKIYQQFTDAVDADAGSIAGTLISINMGTGSSATKGGAIANFSKPSFYNGACIMVAAYRVTVNPAATYGTKVSVGLGTVSYQNPSGTTVPKTYSADTILLYTNYGICSNTVGTNAISSESGGTFGSGSVKDRAASSKVPSGYTYAVFSNATGGGMPGDYYYGVSNNTSGGTTTALGYSTSNSYPYPTNPQRIFGVWDIIGDHTGATNPLLGNPATDDNAGKSGGYMVVINSAYRTDTAFMDTITNLCPNTFYQYSAWFRNMCSRCGCDSNGHGAGVSTPAYIPTATNDSSGVHPNLTFNINGYDYYTTGDIQYTGQWIQKGFTYQTGPSQTSMIINIRNNAPGGGGNDWAIDDIGVATCSPNVSLTPNRPDTLCQGADDTVRFKVSSYFNSYTAYKLEKSTDNGATWTSTGTDTTGAAATGTGTPVFNSSTNLYEYILTRYYRLSLTDTLTTYRITVASSTGNLSNSNCAVANTTHKLVLGVDCLVTLPVNIILFKGAVQNEYGVLQWVSSDETGELNYTVERSDDGIHYEAIAMLLGTAPEGMGATYNFTDARKVGAATYYRISLTGHNFHKYSNVVLLSNSEIDFELKSLVNPFTDWISFDLTVPNDNVATFTLIDMYGRVVRQEKQNVTTGINSIRIFNLANLANSTYTLQVQYTDKIISKHVIKMIK